MFNHRNGSPCRRWSNLEREDYYVTENTAFQTLPLFRDTDFLKDCYINQGLSTTQISKICGSARTTVAQRLIEAGVVLRAQSDYPHRQGQIPYGMRVSSGKLVPHKREQEVLGQLEHLRENGYSYWKIAEVMNDMAIPTKNQNSKWHPTTIMKLLKSRT